MKPESREIPTIAEKALPTRVTMTAVPSTVNKKDRTIECVMTTTKQDRQGDIVESAGLDFAGYVLNPVVLWCHRMGEPPIGNVLSIRQEKEGVYAKVQFAATKFASEVFDLYATGFLRCWSIGFLPKAWESIEPSKEELEAQRAEYERSKNDGTPLLYRRLTWGRRVKAAEVVELSACPVGVNPDAMSYSLTQVMEKALRTDLEEALGKAEKKPEADGEWACPECGHTEKYGDKDELVCPKCNTDMRRRRRKSAKGKSIDEAFRNLLGIGVAPGAMDKSVQERGSSGKVPVKLEFGDEPGVEVEIEEIKSEKGITTEARLLGIRVKAVRPQAQALGEEPPQGGTPEPASRQQPVAGSTVLGMESEIAQARAKCFAFETEMLELERMQT